jgi:hypothetical protein
MKTAPATPTSPRLVYATQDTGDVQVFGITAENYQPAAVRRAARMDKQPFGGFTIEIINRDQTGVVFTIKQDRNTLTMSRANYDPQRKQLTLVTKLMTAPEEAVILADLEQCAAIGLLLPGFPELPG